MHCCKLHEPKSEEHKTKIRASCRTHADRVRRALALLDAVERQQRVPA